MELYRIRNYIQNTNKWEEIFIKYKYNFEKLFSDLIQLYTETIFYSEKKMELKSVENCNFVNEQMKDITDLSGKKIVKYTVLPGLFVNNNVIGKIIVFFEKYKTKKDERLNNTFIQNKDSKTKIVIRSIPKNNDSLYKNKDDPAIKNINSLKSSKISTPKRKKFISDLDILKGIPNNRKNKFLNFVYLIFPFPFFQILHNQELQNHYRSPAF